MYRIRPAEQADAVFLADMLVEAFNRHPDRMRRRVELLVDPSVNRYLAGVPELTLGVRPIHRARGVGRTLLRATCAVATGRGHRRISLSVERANFASRLYVSEGFATLTSGRDADTMVKTLR